MLHTMKKSKIHRATVTDLNLLEASPFTRIFWIRLIFYQMKKCNNLFKWCRSRVFQPGVVIIITNVLLIEEELQKHSPRIVVMDKKTKLSN